MKIAVNTRLLRKNQMDGLGWFAYSTLKHIVKTNPSIEFHFFFDTPVDPSFLFGANVVPHILFPPAKHAFLNIIWFEWSVKRMLERLNPALFFSPDGLLCLGWKGKQHGMIADINFYHHPEDLKWTNHKYYNYFYPKYARLADRLATISQYSKQDIVQTYQADPGKIDVVYCGINEYFQPVDSGQQIRIRNKYTGGKPYFLFVGSIHPRKNLVRLLQAFELFKNQTASGTTMVIAGKPIFKANEVYEQQNIMSHKADVIFTGRIPDDDINDLLGSALALLFVPHFEGFGLPIIEAMQCDVPVICSNTTSMPEVAGDAALLVDPFNVSAIKDAMVRIDAEPVLRSELISKGRQQKTVFSWDRTATALWKSMETCL